MEQEIISFISRFTMRGKAKEVVEVFTSGCCYWFARILLERFGEANGHQDVCIVYDYLENHFGCRINDRVYDITGDCTDRYQWERWPSHEDESLERRIVRDCIMF